MKIHCIISDGLDDIRLDTFLCRHCPALTRNQAAALITRQFIRVNTRFKKPGYRLRPGDEIVGELPEPDDKKQPAPENLPTDIVFEDPHILVINKKAGQVVHPAPGNRSGTLVNALLHHVAAIVSAGNDRFRSGIVHRLDKDTSGLMVVAKTAQALDFLQKEFRQRRVCKIYQALVAGHLLDDEGMIDLPVGRHPVKKTIMCAGRENGKSARTLWRVKKKFESATLVEVRPETGRTHQIRVHFYAIGHPLVGERVYLPASLRRGKGSAPRQMLHASSLSFRHPYSGTRVSYSADFPPDFREILEQMKESNSIS